MKKLALSFGLVAMIALSSCEESIENPIVSSASVTVDGKVYTKPENDIVGFLEFEFNDVASINIACDLVNGEDTLDLSLSIPAIEVATYTKESGVALDAASIYVDLGDEEYSSNPFFTSIEDVSSFTIMITAASDDTIEGNFTATIQTNDLTQEDVKTIDVSGEFVSVNLLKYL